MSSGTIHTPYAIDTNRLRLRPYGIEDLDALHALFTDPGVRRYLLDDEIVSRDWVAEEIRSSVELFTRRGFGQWTLSLTGGGGPIGFSGYRFFHDPPELQLIYGLAPTHWGQGLAAEAARALIRYAFDELGMDTVVASTDAPNNASVRVMGKAGMRFDKRVVLGGLDTIYYSMSRADFEAARLPENL